MSKKRNRGQSMQDFIASSTNPRSMDRGYANFGQADMPILSPSMATQLITLLSQMHGSAPHRSTNVLASTCSSTQMQPDRTLAPTQPQSDLPPFASQAQHDSSIAMGSSRKGRGAARLPRGWDDPSFRKLEVGLNHEGALIGDDAAVYASVCGIYARTSNRLSLAYRYWDGVPMDQKESIWQEIMRNSTMPPEGRGLTLRMIGTLWKEFKATLKRRYFEPYKNGVVPTIIRDTRVNRQQWSTLVDYWKMEDTQREAEQNRRNRAQLMYPAATGRKSHSLILHQRLLEGMSTSQYDMFIATRRWRDKQADPITVEMIEKMEREWEALPEDQRTEASKDVIFRTLFGRESRGRVRCHGKGPTSTSLRMSMNSMTTIQMREEIDQKVEERMQTLQESFITRMESMERMNNERMNLFFQERDDERDAYESRISELKKTVDELIRKLEPSIPSTASGSNLPKKKRSNLPTKKRKKNY